MEHQAPAGDLAVGAVDAVVRGQRAGVRLPALLAAMATVLTVHVFTWRVSGSRAIAWVAALILLGTGGYVEVHVARTATSIRCWCCLSRWRASACSSRSTARGAIRNVALAAVFLVAAVLTKSIAGLLMVPGYALYLLGSGKARPFLSRREVWLVGAGALGAVALFLIARRLLSRGSRKRHGRGTRRGSA